MRILFLTIGPHSGIVASVARELTNLGCSVTVENVVEGFSYRMERLKLPSLNPSCLLNLIKAKRQFGPMWRDGFFYTDYAFKALSKRGRACLSHHRGQFDFVLQSGCLCDFISHLEGIPSGMLIDHTYAISKRSRAYEGLPERPRPSSNWESLEGSVYRSAGVVFPMSECVAGSLRDDYEVENDRIAVVGGGPNFPIPPSVPERPTGKRLLFVGKDFTRKGGRVLLEAFQIVRREIDDAELIIAGSQQQVDDQDGVIWTGFIDSNEVAELMGSSTAFVLPTLREPFGIVFLEAMAFGLPCIGTRLEAIPEIIENGKSGFLVEPGSASELAERCIQLLADESPGAAMGRRGRALIDERFNWPSVAARMLERMTALTAA